MIEHAPWLLLWGTVVGLDLVSFAQVMLARPLVAGTVAGMIVGDPLSGGLVGAILELFALDVLPVGASRYPDYGLGAVAAAAAAAGAPGVLGIGVAVGLGLLVAGLGGWAMQYLRRANEADVTRHAPAIDRGDARALSGVHLRGLARDAIRCLAITTVGLVAAHALRWPIVSLRGAVLLSLVAIGAGLASAAVGAMRLSGRGLDLRWFALGVVAGAVWVALT